MMLGKSESVQISKARSLALGESDVESSSSASESEPAMSDVLVMFVRRLYGRESECIGEKVKEDMGREISFVIRLSSFSFHDNFFAELLL
jgi:hypothetical protein